MASKRDITELQHSLRTSRGAFVSVGFFSLFVNLLMLVPAIYMHQVYDLVFSTHSVDTLLTLTLVVVFLFASMGMLDVVLDDTRFRNGERSHASYITTPLTDTPARAIREE